MDETNTSSLAGYIHIVFTIVVCAAISNKCHSWWWSKPDDGDHNDDNGDNDVGDNSSNDDALDGICLEHEVLVSSKWGLLHLHHCNDLKRCDHISHFWLPRDAVRAIPAFGWCNNYGCNPSTRFN